MVKKRGVVVVVGSLQRGNKYINIPYMKLLVVANGITYYL